MKRKLLETPQLIAELQVGALVDWYYRVLECSKRKKKDGGDFLSLLLMDRSGRIPGKLWENAEKNYAAIQPGNIYHVTGEVSEYNQKKEIRVQQMTPVDEKEIGLDAAQFTEPAPFDTDDLMRQLRELIDGHIRQPYLQRLIDEFFKVFGEKLKIHPGAQKIHHAYPGGLLEHTLHILKLAVFVADLYTLDKELLITGALFHDVGKLSEFQVQPVPEATIEGGLLGHVVIGHSMFVELKTHIDDFPLLLATKLQHLILSHHGEKEFGSPEVPRIPEAYALHLIDLLDSRLNIFRETARKSESKGLFSEFNPALGTRILIERE